MKPNPPHTPPQLLLNLFRWFCKPEYHSDIEGDLLELFAKRTRAHSLRQAKWRMLFDVLWLFRAGIVRPLFNLNNSFIHPAMFKHNLLITYRSFLRHKSTFLINLIGLSTGLTCALLIYLWVQDELKMDRFHEKNDRLYQVMRKYPTSDDGIEVVDWAPGPLASALKTEIPQVEYASSIKQNEIFGGILSYENQHVKAMPIFVESDFFDMFSFPLLHGAQNLLEFDKYGIVVSASIASKLFNDPKEAIGKTLEGDFWDMSGVFTIRGIFEDLPAHSTDHFDVIFTYAYYAEQNPTVNLWRNDQASTCLVLKEGTRPEEIEEKMNEVLASKREIGEEEIFLQKYADQYLYNQFENGEQAGGRIEYIWLFSIIAALVLLIACINFMNLSTAKASIRMKEIGVKKTMGATQLKLVYQFITESILLSFIALLVAFLLIALVLPQFNIITGKQLSLPTDPRLMGIFVGISILTGLFASTYPALYLSGFKPVKILKGKLEVNKGETWARKSLVIFQFALTIIFIVSVLVVYQQVSFIQEKNLGYDRDNILSIRKEGNLKEKLESFLTEVKILPEVDHATNSVITIVDSRNYTGGIDWEGKREDEGMRISVFITNYEFIETFGINLIEGRSFSRAYGNDTTKVILNEAAVEQMRLENPIGQTITFWGNQVQIIGVTENFHFESLYREVKPCIFALFSEDDNYGEHIWIKLKAGTEKTALSKIKEIYHDFNPSLPFEYGFVDEAYDTLYRSEARVAMLSQYFSGLAIIISCLGLFGLATFTAERRQKEMGIRKVLGASVYQLVQLLSAEFTKMVLIAILIGLPIGYLITQRWLESFAYKIELQWWYFILAAGVTLLIAWLTVSVQTFKVARVNPVESLKDE